MKSQDLNGVRTAQNIEQKYDLGAISGMKTAVKQTQTGLTKIEQETQNIIESLIINLDGIVPEGAISLWFYSDKPTLENNPASNWEDDNTKNQHINDLYYDRETGYVYKFIFIQGEGYQWQKQLNGDLVESMALTNASIDTEDNLRQVFFSEPTPPYNNGDWWILENGDLYICQISKETGEYNKNDFIISSEYTYGTRANHKGNVLTVTSGRVTKVEEGIDGLNSTVTETVNDLTVAESQIRQNVDDITLLTTRTDTLGTKTAKLELDVAEIKSEIGEIADITASADGIGSITLENINESEPIYLNVRPTITDIKALYPANDLYPSETLYPSSGATITFANTTDDTTRNYLIPSDLLIYDSQNYDEFILDYENEECYTIHRIGIDGQGNKYVLANPTTEYFTPYPTIELTAGDYTITTSASSAYIFARLMVANIYTTQFATKVELNSSIVQTKNEINAEVSQKVGNNEVISKINLSPETATIQASKVNINGMITAINNNTSTTIDGNKITTGTITASQVASDVITTNNFNAQSINANKITSGTLSAASINLGNGTFSVGTNGVINASSGSIGSATIDGDGIYTGQGNETAGIGKYGSRYAFWAGTNTGNTFNAPFRVTHNGELWATNAHISGQIDASSITSGTLNVDRIPSISASKITAGTVNASKIRFSGKSGGYFEVGTDTIHPKASGLNVDSGGINIGNGRLILSTDGNYATIRNSLNGVGNVLFLDRYGNIITSDGSPITLYEVLSAVSYCMSKGWLKRL